MTSCRWIVVLCVCVVSGCSSLHSGSLISLGRNEKKTPSPSAISQLGVALPAMKPGDERELKLITAEEMVQKGYWKEAVEMYRTAESMAPKKPKLDAELAPALAAIGQHQEAIQRYRRLIDAKPKDAELRNNLAWTLSEYGDDATAESEYRKAIELNPDLQNATINLGILMAKQSRYDEALATLKRAIGEASAHHNIGVIAIDNGDEATAIRAFTQASNLPGAPESSAEFLASLTSLSENRFRPLADGR
jgi:Flp pilus assembly protein TadD